MNKIKNNNPQRFQLSLSLKCQLLWVKVDDEPHHAGILKDILIDQRKQKNAPLVSISFFPSW